MPFKFLSSTYPLRDYFFCVPHLCLSSMGFWPEKQQTHLNWIMANFLILFIGVVTEIHAGCKAITEYNLELALDTLCPAGTSAVTLLKMYLIWYYRNDLEMVLQRMRSMLYAKEADAAQENAPHTFVKKKIIRAHAIVAARLNFIPFVMGFITCTSYNLKPLLISLLLLTQGKSVEWKMPFNMTLPSILFKSPFYPFTYLFTAYTGYITIFMYGGCDAFYFEFCSNIAALLKILQEDIQTVFLNNEDKWPLTSKQSKDMEAQLIRIIRQHNDIIELTYFFRKRYTIITLVHFVSAGMVIGASIFDLMTFSGFGIIIYIGYTIAVLGQLFIYCYGGSLVVESSTQLAKVVSTCDWHICTPKLRRMLLLLIMRSQKALTMSVPFFSPSLFTFTRILRSAGSIIALASSFK